MSNPTKAELDAAQAAGCDLCAYGWVREDGATHAEALAAYAAGCNLYDYGWARWYRATHAEALAEPAVRPQERSTEK